MSVSAISGARLERGVLRTVLACTGGANEVSEPCNVLCGYGVGRGVLYGLCQLQAMHATAVAPSSPRIRKNVANRTLEYLRDVLAAYSIQREGVETAMCNVVMVRESGELFGAMEGIFGVAYDHMHLDDFARFGSVLVVVETGGFSLVVMMHHINVYCTPEQAV